MRIRIALYRTVIGAALAGCLVATGVGRTAPPQTYTITKIVDTNDGIPGLGGITCVAVNNAGQVAAAFSRVLIGDGGTPTIWGDAPLGCVSIADDGSVAYARSSPTNPGRVELIRRTGSAVTVIVDSSSQSTTSGFNLPSMSRSASAIGWGGTPSFFQQPGIYTWVNGLIQSPDPTRTLSNVSPGTVNNSGAIAFLATRVVNGTTKTGVYRGSALPLVEDHTGVQVSLGSPVVNNNGTVAFMASINGVGGLYTTDDGTSFTYQGPGPDNSTLRAAINDSGQVVYRRAFSGGAQTGLVSGPNQDPVVLPGTAIGTSTVANVLMWCEALNNRGQVAFYAILADGTRGIYRADPVDATAPTVTAPAPISITTTEAGGARGSASATLAAFLAAGSAIDNADPNPQRLAPQVAGVDASNATFFPVGSTTVTFRFQDATGNIGSATSSVTVSAPVNVAPTASNDHFTTLEDTPYAGTLAASDANNDPLTFSIVSNGSKGTAIITNAATGAFTYTPTTNANGSDSFTFRANDGLLDSNVATITIDITPVDDPPSVPSGVVTTTEGVVVTGQLPASDVDSQSLTFALANQPAQGLVTLTDAATGAFTYSPAPGFTGYDPFSFTVSDGVSTRTATEMVFVVAAAPRWPGQTIRASESSAGVQGNNASFVPSLSADGRYVAFLSSASNLVSGDTNNGDDVFVRDRVSGQVTRVSVATGGVQGNRGGSTPSISADGRFVVFESASSNLASPSLPFPFDVFIHDRTTGQTTRISTGYDGSPADHDSRVPVVSADGRYVAFQSASTNLVPGDTNALSDVFVFDRVAGQMRRISVGPNGVQGNGGSFSPRMSADGRFISFQSSASNLVAGDANGKQDIFVFDQASGQLSIASVASDGSQSNASNIASSLSADGRYVVFYSSASNLVPGDTNGAFDVFVRDRQTNQTSRVSLTAAGAQAAGGSYDPAISADGRYVSFTSDAALTPDDTNGVSDIYVRDLVAGRTVRVSVGNDGGAGNAASVTSTMSADGRFVAFESLASTLVGGDSNAQRDVFVVGGVTVTPQSQSFGNAGGNGSINLSIAFPGGSWTAAAQDGWVTNLNPASGSGSATIGYTVSPNPGAARATTITAALQPIAISQAAGPPVTPGEVAVDPHGYSGDWAVGGVTHRGPATVTLPLGISVVTIAGHSTFAINIDSFGLVSVPAGVSATGGFGTLTFVTQDVSVSPGSYTGSWMVDHITDPQQGPGTVTFVGGLQYTVIPGMSQASFNIFVQAADGLVQVTNSISASGGLRVLTFNTISIAVDPGAYSGPWGLEKGTDIFQGPGTVTLVSGAWSLMKVNGTGSFFITTDAAGQVSVQNGVSAVGGQASLTFNTDQVAIDTAGFAGNWNVEQLTPVQAGPGTATVVRSADFQVNAGTGSFGGVHFVVETDGTVTVKNGVSAIGGLRTITLKTFDVRIDPGADNAGWFISGTTPVKNGVQRVKLVPGAGFEVESLQGAAQVIAIGSPCSVTPRQFTLAGFSYQATCVTDTTAPTLFLPADITAPAADISGVVVTYAATASDDVDGAVTVQCGPASGSTFPIGVTTVTCSASDIAGNTATGSFAITVTKLPSTVQWSTPADIVVGTTLGGAQLNATASVAGTFTYTPSAGTILTAGSHQLAVAFAPTDNVHYAASSASVTIVVINPSPVAQSGSATTNEDTPVSGVLSASDPNSDPLTFTIVANGTKGTATVTNPATGAFTYTPGANKNGTDTFTFKVNDGTSDSNVATMTVTITAVNDAPVATAAAFTTNEDTPVSGQLPATDVDQDALTFTRVSGGSKGRLTITNAATGAFTYTPYLNANGADTVTFSVSDGQVSSTATITINIMAVNDAPVAHGQIVPVLANRPEAIALGAADPEGSALAFAVVQGPSHGSLTGTAPTLTYTPAADYSGPDNFTFTATDGQLTSNVATVLINVATTRWTSKGPGAGSVLALAVDPTVPSLVFAGTSAGLFRSTDGAATWTGNSQTGYTTAIAIDPTHPGTVYAATNNSVYKSTDGGGSWVPLLPASVRTVLIEPTNSSVIYAGTATGVKKSVDGGLTWASSSTGLPAQLVLSLAGDPSSPGTLYCGTAGFGAFKSSNGGATWTKLAGVPDNSNVWALVVDPSSPTTLYAGIAAQAAGAVLRSTDGGASWITVGNGLSNAQVFGLSMASTTGALYAATNFGVFKSTNAGSSWSIQPNLNDQAISIAVDPTAGLTLYAGTGSRGVYKSTDGGSTWNVRSAGIAAARVRSITRVPSLGPALFAGLDGGVGIFESADDGRNWQRTGAPGGAFVYSIVSNPLTPNTLYATQLSVLKSLNGGATWSTTPAPCCATSLVIDPSAPSTLYTAINGQSIGKSTDGGTTWSTYTAGLTSLRVYSLAIDAVHPQTLYTGTTDAGVFKSTNGGVSWSASSFGLGPATVTALATDPLNPTTVYAGLSSGSGGIYKSTNGGATWAQQSNGLPANTSINSLVIHPTSPALIWAATGRGIFASADGGLNWKVLPGTTNVNVNAVAINPDDSSILFAATDAGVFKFETAEAAAAQTTTGSNVAVTPSVVLPSGTTTSVSMTFSSVNTAGTTDVTAENGGTPPPDGFTFGDSPIIYDVQTTAAYTGPIQICFSWQEGQLKNESTARLFHYEGGSWHDVTTSLDTVANRICGTVTSLSPFAIGEVTYQFGGFLTPLLPDGSASIQQTNGGRTVPIKFQLRWHGQLTGAATATIAVYKVLDAATGNVDTTNLTQDAGASSDSGVYFRYDASSQQYVYNMSTKGWTAPATYRVVVTLSDGSVYSVDFSLR